MREHEVEKERECLSSAQSSSLSHDPGIMKLGRKYIPFPDRPGCETGHVEQNASITTAFISVYSRTTTVNERGCPRDMFFRGGLKKIKLIMYDASGCNSTSRWKAKPEIAKIGFVAKLSFPKAWHLSKQCDLIGVYKTSVELNSEQRKNKIQLKKCKRLIFKKDCIKIVDRGCRVG